MVSENQTDQISIGRDDSPEFQSEIANLTNPVYSLDGEELNELFQINPMDGTISTRRALDRENEMSFTGINLDFSTSGRCILVVVIVNDAIRSLVNIKVSDVNDNRPVFTMPEYTIEVFETTSTVPILECRGVNELTAVDKDEGINAMIRYSVEQENDTFEIMDPAIPCVQNKPGVILDRDVPPTMYSFTLVATDINKPIFRSEARVTYLIQDLNDNAPVFTREAYTFEINETLQPGEAISPVRAQDIDFGMNGNAGLRYRVSGSDLFEINETEGVLMLAGEVDAEFEDTYTLTVSVTDMGMGGTVQTASVPVIVNILDVNENVSVIRSRFVTQLAENELVRGVGLIEIRDTDKTDFNKNNSIRVAVGADKFNIVPFTLNMLTNTYRLEQIEGVDYEQNTTVLIKLEITAGGQPEFPIFELIELNVTDVNDNPPNLGETDIRFTEEVSGNQLIVDLSEHVFDRDSGANGIVGHYQLISVMNSTLNLTPKFDQALNATSGRLSTGNVRIDREEIGNSLSFVVNLTDMGVPPLSQLVNFTVTILDTNDNAPVFEMARYIFQLDENEPPQSPVGTVRAMDPDYAENGIVIYSIISPSPSLFSINERTGEITSTVGFDREVRNKFVIYIQARDAASVPRRSAINASVTVMIGDRNDEKPMFVDCRNASIETSLKPGGEVITVMATDEDSDSSNKIIAYTLQSNTSLFSIKNISLGTITLDQPLNDDGVYEFNVSAFNPGIEELKSICAITVTVTKAPFDVRLIAGILGGASFVVILIIVVAMILICTCYKNMKYRRQYSMKDTDISLNNQNSILKIPATNGQQGRSRVTFKERVEETHYVQQSVVNDTDNTIRKESITKFDNSPRLDHGYNISSDEDASLDPSQPESLTVVELEMSPGRVMNGDIPVHHGYNMRPHSPIVHVVGRGREEVDYNSQGTSSDGHTYMDDEESMFSDDASIINTALPRYASERHSLDIQYETPSTHSHLELHRHLPPMSHGQPTNSSLAQLHAYNQAQLAEANRMQHYGSMHNTSDDHSLTLTPHGHIQHASISTQSSTHSPPSPQHPQHPQHPHPPHLGASSGSKHLHSGGRNYPHPLVMPDAFPRDTTDIHRFPIGSYVDYGEASTYASTELDEALGFNLDAEPGIISLTATTDYEDTEL